MKLNKDFKLINKDKIILCSIIGFFALVALGNWIATSFGNFDNHMSEMFYKGMDIDFFRGWAAYTVMDGYTVVISYLIPLGLLLVLCLLAWAKKYKPNSWLSHHTSWYKYLFAIVTVIFEIAIIFSFYFWNYKDQGFGTGYSMEFIVNKAYTIPSFVVSVLLGNVVYFLLNWWYYYHLSKRQDFLELKVWRPIVRIAIFMALSYIVAQGIVKGVNPRPYWYAIHFTDGVKIDGIDYSNVSNVEGNLARFERLYPAAFHYYVYDQSSFYYGWYGLNDPHTAIGKLQNWPTSVWTNSKGKTWTDMRDFKWFRNANHLPFYCQPAFPSGHMIATTVICLTPTVAFPTKARNQKEQTAKIICWTIAGVYMLDMAWALEISASHYWSDIMFTMGFDPIYYIIGAYATHWIFKGFNKGFKTTKW